MSEPVSTPHPDYARWQGEWELMRRSCDGETAIKDAGEAYLPMPGGFRTHQDRGAAAYGAYRTRAQYPEITTPAVQAMVGVIHRAEIGIDLPASMQGLWERATSDGLPLEAFHRRVTAELLSTGRYAVLADASAQGSLPHFVGYPAEALINWTDDGTMYVLDESGLVRDGFVWAERKQYLALLIEDGRYIGRRYDEAGNPIDEEAVEPVTARRESLAEIPLVVIGPRGLSVSPEPSPLIGVARSALAIYQLSADYRWQLFMSGQETLVVINGDAPSQVGAGVVVTLRGGEGLTPNAKYVGPSGKGIEAHRTAIQDEAQSAANAGAKLFNTGHRAAESGDALQIRFTAETASLISVAQASCAGLERALRYAGRLMGLGDAEIASIVVTPPKTLVDREITPEMVSSLIGLWEKGLIADETVYENLQAGSVASAERDWTQESGLIARDDDARDVDVRAAQTPQPEPA